VLGGVGGAHEVNDAVGGVYVEVEVDLAAAHVGVRRHGVPVAAGGEEGEAHDELAALDAVGEDGLVDGALVAGFERAEFEAFEVGEFDHRGGVGGVGEVAEQVKGGGVGGVGAGEDDGFGAAAGVENVHLGEVVGLAVDGDGAGAAGVEDAQFAALEEGFGAEFGLGFEGERGGGGDGGADDGALEVDVGEVELAGLKEVFEEEGFAEFGGGHARVADGVCHLVELHGSPSVLCLAGVAWTPRQL